MRFIQVDEEGYFSFSGIRLTDENYGRHLLSTLTCENRGYFVSENNEKIFVEAFDEPLVARHIERVENRTAIASLPYGLMCAIDLATFRVDRWDRFHARTIALNDSSVMSVGQNLPVVLSRPAQMEVFDLADEFDDDSLTLHGVRYPVTHLGQLIEPDKPVNSAAFWTNLYDSWQTPATGDSGSTVGQKPGWELGAPAEPLHSVLPQIKLPKSRICVLGSGVGHDAAYFAEQGHVVTGVDFSETAISLARAKYGSSANFVTANAFEFAKARPGEFDVVFEHTFFCAVDPARRMEVVEAWSRLLAPGGHLLGIFFTMDRGRDSCEGPPFGATEWEIRELLKSKFEFLYWTRWHHSIPQRLGRELIIYARKIV